MASDPSDDALSWSALAVRDALSRTPDMAGKVPPIPALDTAAAARAWHRLGATDPARARVIAETLATLATRSASNAWKATWDAHPVRVRPDDPAPHTFASLHEAFTHTPSSDHRAVLSRAADARALEAPLRTTARDAVVSLRAQAGTLSVTADAWLETLGHGPATTRADAARAALSDTRDAYRELFAWSRARAGLPAQGTCSWADTWRLRLPFSATSTLPIADRGGIATRWLQWAGAESWARSLHDTTATPSERPTGLRAIVRSQPSRVVWTGSPPRSALSVREACACAGASLAAAALSEADPFLRLGRDAVTAAVLEALVRRLLLDRSFLHHAAGLDRGRESEECARELLFVELFHLRLDAACALTDDAVLAQTPDIAEHFRARVSEAVGAAPEPAWAVQWAAGLLERTSGLRTLGAVLEPQVHERLRQTLDADWYRNPRTSAVLARWIGDWHAAGTLACLAPSGPGTEPLAARVRAWFDALA